MWCGPLLDLNIRGLSLFSVNIMHNLLWLSSLYALLSTNGLLGIPKSVKNVA